MAGKPWACPSDPELAGGAPRAWRSARVAVQHLVVGCKHGARQPVDRVLRGNLPRRGTALLPDRCDQACPTASASTRCRRDARFRERLASLAPGPAGGDGGDRGDDGGRAVVAWGG